MLFLWALAFILILQQRDLQAAADPVSVLPGSLGRGSWCDEHDKIHERLDIIEEKVIKTVEHLESEVKSLLNIINETTSNIPIAPGAPLIDIFDGKYLVGYNIS
ncbi:PREDICTED: placenta-specific protein 9 [Tauraco erythrolophus]|nr:PREDICTED: placenta-specific protein 9 [Tauraco erythrolophus]